MASAQAELVPHSGEWGPSAATMPHSLLQRKVSGPLQTRNRQLLEDNQRVKREDRRRAARVPIGLRHRAADLYNSGTPTGKGRAMGLADTMKSNIKSKSPQVRTTL